VRLIKPDDGLSDMNDVLVQRAAGMCVPEHARRLAAAWNAFLEAETTAIETVAVRRIRRAYRKKHPEWRQKWDRLLRKKYAVERRAAMKIVT
jgi:hypothetical protein